MAESDRSAGPELEFALLGEVAVRRGGAALEAGSPQQRAVLARLLLADGRVVPLSDLVDGLWGEEPPARAVGTVRTYVSRLRALLDPDADGRGRHRLLVSVGDGYALRLPQLRLDVREFERLRAEAGARLAAGDGSGAAALLARALGLWGGEPLAGVPGPFAGRERDRLAEARLSAVEELAAVELELGRDAQVLALLGPVVAEHPLRERPRAALMLALYRSGRQAEALGLYTDTRRLLVEELGVEPGPELAELHRRILRGDPELPAGARASGGPEAGEAEPAAPEPIPVPAQLPRDISDFTGRRAEVETLVRSLSSARERAAVTVHGLSGIGGVGKSTLAVHVAHRVRAAFPDGQLYADLGGVSAAPAEPAALLGDFLLALGVPAEQLPDAVEQRSALLRSRLADRRVLLLLDNARDAAQVLPLIPGTAGSAVLVTSRVRLAGIPGAVLTELAAPEELEALELLAAVAGFARIAGEGEAARELVEACARLPLAVRIVASRLAARPGWSVESLLDRLRDEQRRLAELRVGDLAVEASFELGYRQLSERQARAFRLLAVPDGPGFATASAAALLGTGGEGGDTEGADTEDLLESLVDTGLLEAEAIGRYRYHDLVRIFARQHAERADSAEDREQAVQQLLEHLLARVCAAQGPLAGDEELAWRLHVPEHPSEVGGFADDDSAWAWLRGERPGILALAGTALRLAPERALHPVVDLLIGCIWIFEHEAPGQGWGRLLDQALARAVAVGDAAAEGRLRYLSGLLHGLVDELPDAEHELRRAVGLLAQDANLEIRCTVASELAVTLTASDRAEEALAYLEQARLLAAELGHLPDEARLLSNIARGHLAAGRIEEARRVAEASLLTARASGNPYCVADAHYQVGNALAGAADHLGALEHLGAARQLYSAQRRRGYEALSLARMALAQAELGSSGAALLLAEQALDATAGAESPYCRALALWATGLALRSTREQGRARICLEESLRLFEGMNAPETEQVRELVRLSVGVR